MRRFQQLLIKKHLPILPILIGALLLSACGLAFRGDAPAVPARGWGWGGQYASNGEQIYFTATNDRGRRIRYSGGPSFGGMMMGQRLTCAACHGTDGRGGLHMMHMDVMDAPDIRYSALSGEADEHSSEADEHAHGGEYTLDTFRKAVVKGQHPNGDPLDRDMPRWQLDDDDLADLLEFLKTLP